MNDASSPRFVLRQLPVAPRLVLALFLTSVGLGYLSALVQVHFQHASPGNLFPSPADSEDIFSGPKDKPRCQLESLLEADESKPFNGQGQMRAAFTKKSDNWKGAIKTLARQKKVPLDQAEHDLRAQRDGERLALLEWIDAGAAKEDFQKDHFHISDELAAHPITEDYLQRDDKNKPVAVKIRSVLTDRCFRCHAPDGEEAQATQYPLNTYVLLKPYTQVKESAGMSLTKLAQTTHVHLLGFSLLYGLTGLIFAFSSYPGWVRGLLGPLTLAAQLAEIACWWLARLDRVYADCIVYLAGLVAVALLLQIVLSLFNMFGKAGKTVLVLLILAGCLGGYAAKEYVIDPYMVQEKAAAVAADQ